MEFNMPNYRASYKWETLINNYEKCNLGAIKIPCYWAEKDNFSGFISTDDRFFYTSVGIIIDFKNNLMWDASWHKLESYGWENAIKYVNNCNKGGYTDWRLPTIDELTSISDEKYNPTYHPMFDYIPDYHRGREFVSSSIANNKGDLWRYSYVGQRKNYPRIIHGEGLVRCVRKYK